MNNVICKEDDVSPKVSGKIYTTKEGIITLGLKSETLRNKHSFMKCGVMGFSHFHYSIRYVDCQVICAEQVVSNYDQIIFRDLRVLCVVLP